MEKKKHIGICAICGKEKVLTFEHFPPEAALNRLPVMIQNYDHLIPIGNPYLYGKSKKSNKGMGDYRLCEPCNNNSGSWYAKNYSEFVNQNLEQIINKHKSQRIEFISRIKPLNFIKQVLIFHLCSDRDTGTIRRVLDSEKLILNRTHNVLSKDVKIFMYATFSNTHRNMGICTLYSSQLNGIVNYSEFNFHPFGFLFTLNSQPPNYNMQKITNFINYEYDDEVELGFNLPNLQVKSLAVGHYP